MIEEFVLKEINKGNFEVELTKFDDLIFIRFKYPWYRLWNTKYWTIHVALWRSKAIELNVYTFLTQKSITLSPESPLYKKVMEIYNAR